MSDPICDIQLIFMRTQSTKKKVAKAPAKAKNSEINVNVEYVERIADEAISTIMALRGLVRVLVAELEDRK
jgi:hypothetical protein